MAVCDYCANGDHEVPKVQPCECPCHGDKGTMWHSRRAMRRILVLAGFVAAAFGQ